jgi:cytochrome c oxidase cbb3-type subunit 3
MRQGWFRNATGVRERRLSPSRLFLVGSLIFAAGAAACDRPPSKELTDWTPADHDGEQKGGGTGKQGAKGDAGGTPALVEIAWRQQCASCHGAGGKGDGPQGPMFKAADLTTPEWQGKVKDEDIVNSIQNGKGRMPKFDLPPDVVKGLVVRIRSFRGQ